MNQKTTTAGLRRTPPYKDHDAIRSDIANAVIDEIYEAGLEKLTLRGVARRLGCSTTVILSYYVNKDDLLVQVHTLTSRRGLERLKTAAAEQSDSLFDLLKVLLPIDEERRREWAIWIAFWGAAIGNRKFAATQRAGTRGAARLVHAFIDRMGKGDQAAGSRDGLSTARSLLLHVYGIALEAVFDSKSWPPAKQLAELRAQCDRVMQP